MKYQVFSVLAITVVASIFSSTHALTPKEEKGVITLQSPSLAYESPEWLSPYIDMREAPVDIEYRKSVLPRDEYQNEDMYIVLPTLGVVSPVVEVPVGTSDFNKMMGGEEIDINSYLNDGVMFYPGTAPVGTVGNPVIFGHSNFFKAGEGNFKTIFADIMNLDVGVDSEMWVYRRKPGQDEYDKYRYEITRSYETTPDDVEILQPQGGKELTVFACTNGLAGRWILRGKLIENDEVLITFDTRIRMRKLADRLSQLPPATQQQIRTTFDAAINRVEASLPSTLETYEDKYMQYVLDWMKKVI